MKKVFFAISIVFVFISCDTSFFHKLPSESEIKSQQIGEEFISAFIKNDVNILFNLLPTNEDFEIIAKRANATEAEYEEFIKVIEEPSYLSDARQEIKKCFISTYALSKDTGIDWENVTYKVIYHTEADPRGGTHSGYIVIEVYQNNEIYYFELKNATYGKDNWFFLDFSFYYYKDNETISSWGYKSDNTSDNESNSSTNTSGGTFLYSGKIDNKYDIVVELTINGSEVTGRYYYVSNGTDMKLKGSTVSGYATINEYNDRGSLTGVFKGNLAVGGGGSFAGSWEKPDGSKSLSFSLLAYNGEYKGNSSSSFDVTKIQGSYSIEYNNSYKTLEVSYLGSNKFDFEISTASELGCTRDYAGQGVVDNFGSCLYYESQGGLIFNFNTSNKTVKVEETGDISNSMGGECAFGGTYKKN